MSKYCQVCRDNRIYLDVVAACPECGRMLDPWEDVSVEADRAITEIDVPLNMHTPSSVRRQDTDPVPWLVGALVILVLVAVLVRQPI